MKKSIITTAVFFAVALSTNLSAQVLSLEFNGNTLTGTITGDLTANPYGNIGWTSTGSYGTQVAAYYITSGTLTGSSITLWDNGGTWAFKYEGSTPGNVFGDLTFTASSVSSVNLADNTLYNGGTYSQWHPASGSSTLQVSAIPEPSTYAAILGGLALLGLGIRRRFKQTKQ